MPAGSSMRGSIAPASINLSKKDKEDAAIGIKFDPAETLNVKQRKRDCDALRELEVGSGSVMLYSLSFFKHGVKLVTGVHNKAL